MIPNPIKRSGAGSLFRIARKGKWGYMDRTGATIIAPQFDWEGDFMGGLAKVLIDGKWGYINEQGHIVIPPQFDDAGDFTGELAPVQVGRKWGYVDKHGLLVITPQFQGAGEFHEGLARFEEWDSIICAQDDWRRTFTKANAPLYAIKLHDDPVFSNTRACGTVTRRLGYLNAGGEVTIPAQFYDALDFSEGMAAVRFRKPDIDNRWGFINTAGALAIHPQFVQTKPFHEGLAAVELGTYGGLGQYNEWGFVDRQGNWAIPAVLRGEPGSFSEGVASVFGNDGLGYVNHAGQPVIPARFTMAREFADGVALVRGRTGNSFYIDHSGNSVIDPKGFSLWSFSDGLSVVLRDDQQFYIDLEGATVALHEDASWRYYRRVTVRTRPSTTIRKPAPTTKR